MNWTGGRLSRHSGKRGGNLINIQKQHFAKVRTNLQNSNRRASPLKLTFFDRYQAPPRASTSRHRRDSLEERNPNHERSGRESKAAIQTHVRSRNKLPSSHKPQQGSAAPGTPRPGPSSGVADETVFLQETPARDDNQSHFFLVKSEVDADQLYDEPSPQYEKHQRSSSNPPLQRVPANKSPLLFEQQKRKLLEQPDWVGTSRTRPVQLQFPAAGARREIGKRRRINDEDRKRREEPPRRPYQPLISERLEPESRLIRPNYLADLPSGHNEWNFGESAISIHIGQQPQTSQPTSQWSGIHTSPPGGLQRSSSELMLLDQEEAAEGPDNGQISREYPRRTYKSRHHTDYRSGPSAGFGSTTLAPSEKSALFSEVSGHGHVNLSPKIRQVRKSFPNTLEEQPSFSKAFKKHAPIRPLSVADALGQSRFSGGDRSHSSYSVASELSLHASSLQSETHEQDSRGDGDHSGLPESALEPREVSQHTENVFPMEARPKLNRLIFRPPLPSRSNSEDSDKENQNEEDVQLASSAMADAGTQEGEGLVSAPEDVVWRDWLAIPAASTLRSTYNSQESTALSRSESLGSGRESARSRSQEPVATNDTLSEKLINSNTTPEDKELAPQMNQAIISPPTKPPLDPITPSEQAKAPDRTEPKPAPKPVNQDELWMKFVFGNDDNNEDNLFNTALDTTESPQRQNGLDNPTIRSDSSMLAQASTAPISNQPAQPHPTLQPTSNRAIEAAKFLFSDYDSSILSTCVPGRPSSVEKSSSGNITNNYPQPTTPSDPMTCTSIHANPSSTSPSFASQPSSLAQASMQNHDPAITSSPDPLLLATSPPNYHRTQRQKIVFTKPPPFIGKRSQESTAFHIGRKVIGGEVGSALRGGTEKKRGRMKSVYDLPESEDGHEGEEEDEEMEGIEDD